MDDSVAPPLRPRKPKPATLPIVAWWTGLILFGAVSAFSFFSPVPAAMVFRLSLVAWIAAGIAYRNFSSTHVAKAENLRNIAVAALATGTVTYFVFGSSVDPDEIEMGVEEAGHASLQLRAAFGVFLAVGLGALSAFKVTEIAKEKRRRRRRSHSGR